MKALLEYIISFLVDNPKNIVIEEKTEENNKSLLAYIPKEEMGKVIGKKGKFIKAIRTLLRILEIKENSRVNFQLLEKD